MQSLMNRELPSVGNDSPWLSTLEQELGKCKLPGNFHSDYSRLCTGPADLTEFIGESYSLHLMKAITATVYGLRSTAFDALRSNPNVLFDSKNIGFRYKELLQVRIPEELEGTGNLYQPFTQEGSDSNTFGNGRVGYIIYNIDGSLNYIEVITTGHNYSDELEDFKTSVEFYKSGKFSPFIDSASSSGNCAVKPIITDTTADAPPSNSPLVGGLIALGCILGLLVIAVVAVIVASKTTSMCSFPLCIALEVGLIPLMYFTSMSFCYSIGVNEFVGEV